MTLTSCFQRQLGEQFFERFYVICVLKALVLGFQSQRKIDGRQHEMAIRVAHERAELVSVVQQTSHVPVKLVQCMTDSLAD